MTRKKKGSQSKRPETTVKILEVTEHSGLTPIQKRLLEESQYAVIQYPYMNVDIQAQVHAVRNRIIKPSQLPKNIEKTQRHILGSIYKRRKKPTYISGIAENTYTQHAQATLEPYNQGLLEAEDHFYCTDLEQTLESAKQAFQHLVRYKQTIERNIIGELFDISKKIPDTDPTSVCFITQAESPQVADSLSRFYSEHPTTSPRTFSPFSLDFPTQLYQNFTRGKFKNPDYDLQDLDYLKLTLHTILLNLSINESDMELDDFRMQEPWLNKIRNAIINVIDYEDILAIREVANQQTYCSDKSVVYIKEFKKRLPETKAATDIAAIRYLQQGFKQNLPQ